MSRMTPDEKRVVFASSLGTMFEWYDFFMYGALAANIAKSFFGQLPAAQGFLFSLLAFAAGFIVRPFGALFFGRLGDLVGRKYSFLLTIGIMGVSTFFVGLLPGYQTIGIAAPIVLIVLRMLQGLAIGGEYGAAATYVAEYAPAAQRGRWTAWIQTTSTAGLLLSLVVILIVRALTGDSFDEWGWRVPFLLSFVLFIISLYVRYSMSESPAFLRVKQTGTLSRAPLREAFLKPENAKKVFFALFGLLLGQGVVWFTGLFYTMFFLGQTLKIDPSTTNMLTAVGLAISAPFYILFGMLSDRIGRKAVILGGCVIAAVTIFPVFKALTHFGNPALEAALATSPVVLRADPADCAFQFNPTGTAAFANSCDIAKQALSAASANYSQEDLPGGSPAKVSIRGREVDSVVSQGLAPAELKTRVASFRKSLSDALSDAGYPRKAAPDEINKTVVTALLAFIMIVSAMTLAPMAAVLVELFPTQIRYSAISLPYHIGNGWFGGLLPSICFALVAWKGDIYFGLWYPVGGAIVCAVIGMLFVRESTGCDLQTVHRSDDEGPIGRLAPSTR